MVATRRQTKDNLPAQFMVEIFELIEDLPALSRVELQVQTTRRIFPFIVPVENCANGRLDFILCARIFEQFPHIRVRSIGRETRMHKLLGHLEELLRAALGIFHFVKKFAAVPSRGGLLRKRRGSHRTP